MRRLDLDFRRAGRTQRSLAVAGMGLLVVGALAAATCGWRYRALEQELDTLRAELARLDKPSRPAARPAAQSKDLAPQLQRAEQVIRQLALPWDDLFRTLEASSSKKVALLSIQPDAVRHEVRIGAEAKDLPAMVGYVERLQHNGWFTQAYLQSHQVREQQPERPVRFTVSASWAKTP